MTKKKKSMTYLLTIIAEEPLNEEPEHLNTPPNGDGRCGEVEMVNLKIEENILLEETYWDKLLLSFPFMFYDFFLLFLFHIYTYTQR